MRLRGGLGGFVAALAGAALTAGGIVPLAVGGSAAAAPALLAAASQLPDFGNPNGHAAVPLAGRAVSTSHPNHVIGKGTPASCTSAAVVKAVTAGGIITFKCGPAPVTITLTATAKVRNTSHLVVLDGGGLVTLSGGGVRRILYQNTCDPKQRITTSDCFNQRWPQLIVQNMTFTAGNSKARQTNGNFGGAAIRALAQWRNRPVYITSDTFRGGRCSNGGALSSIGVSWVVLNSMMTGNKAIGFGANPARAGTPGGGSGGAIYTDGNRYSVKIAGTVISNNSAREGGGAIFFVSDNNTGTLTIGSSTLHHNPSAGFSTPGFPGIFFHSAGHPRVTNSTIN